MRRIIRGITATSLALTIAACGDSTAPNVTLDDEQIADMMDAMANAGVAGFTPPPVGNLAVITINESVECPNGGTLSIDATINEGESTGPSSSLSTAVSMTITQGFTGCKSASSRGRVWTFNGKPNIVSTFNGTSNATTGAFTLSGSQSGGVTFSSDLGTGSCDFDVTFSMSGNENTEQFSGSVTGTVCGRSVSQSLTAN